LLQFDSSENSSCYDSFLSTETTKRDFTAAVLLSDPIGACVFFRAHEIQRRSDINSVSANNGASVKRWFADARELATESGRKNSALMVPELGNRTALKYTGITSRRRLNHKTALARRLRLHGNRKGEERNRRE
jgi:hypothetical protein